MLAMDQIHHIRVLFYEQGYNISEIAEFTGHDWKTVAKYIDMADFNEPIPVPASKQQFCPKLEPYKALIDGWLKEDKNHPRKQRHTAKRVYRRLVDEAPGFNCSYRLVAEYVKYRNHVANPEDNENNGSSASTESSDSIVEDSAEEEPTGMEIEEETEIELEEGQTSGGNTVILGSPKLGKLGVVNISAV